MNAEAVFYYFLRVYPYFLIEIGVGEALFVYRCRRKPYFALRLAAGIILLFTVTFLTTCVQFCLPQHWLLGVAVYIILFSFTLAVLKICFNEKFKILLLCGIASYAVQNMIYRFYTLFEITGVVWNFAVAINSYDWAAFIVTAGLAVVVCVLVYFLYVRRMNAKGLERVYSRNVLLFSIITLLVTVLLCSFTNMWAWQHYYLAIISYCFAILCNIFILTILSGMTARGILLVALYTVRRMWEQDKRNYELSKENIELINIKVHDLKHRFREMRLSDGSLSEEECKEFENSLAVYDSRVTTGCAPLDVLLTEKSLMCNKSGIKLSCLVDGAALSFMGEYDLYSMFGNILSNAIEAVQKVKDEQNRVISLTVSERYGAVMINCINYYEGEIKISGGLPETSKTDKERHGLGMKSLKLLVKKHGGEFNFDFSDGTFNLTVMLPIPQKTHKNNKSQSA
ncbi:MAG: GHKL domain-containing protein [Clostridia bacterium]|nr:GHKL domain-containing protein [Clostridia bacterium]